MRLVDGLLAVSVLAMIAGVITLGVRNTADAPAPAQATNDLEVATVDMVGPTRSPTRWTADDPSRAGRIRFVLPAGETLAGVGSATVFAEDDGRPLYSPLGDFTGVQDGNDLVLTQWLAEYRPAGPHWLRAGLWIDRNGKRETRATWVRFDASRLVYSGLESEAPRGHASQFAVQTGGGVGVPGVLLGVDPDAGLPPGVLTVYAYTDENGEATVSGLLEDRDMLVAAIDGVGPVPPLPPHRFRTPVEHVIIDVPALDDGWAFTRLAVALPHNSLAAKLERVDGEGPLPTAWPVSLWCAPGRGGEQSAYVMHRRADRPLPAVLHFHGFPPLSLPDVRVPQRCTFDFVRREIAADDGS